MRPVARIKARGSESDFFYVERGMRQVCPYSPLLFALYLEPYIQHLARNQLIEPIVINNSQTSLLAYADDIAILTTGECH